MPAPLAQNIPLPEGLSFVDPFPASVFLRSNTAHAVQNEPPIWPEKYEYISVCRLRSKTSVHSSIPITNMLSIFERIFLYTRERVAYVEPCKF